jgi:hypothetical protein
MIYDVDACPILLARIPVILLPTAVGLPLMSPWTFRSGAASTISGFKDF